MRETALHALVAGKDFVNVFRPSETEFNLFLKALAVELEELGTEMCIATGEKL